MTPFARKQYSNVVIGARYSNAVTWLVQDIYTLMRQSDIYPYAAIWLVWDTYPNAAIWLVRAKYHSTLVTYYEYFPPFPLFSTYHYISWTFPVFHRVTVVIEPIGTFYLRRSFSNSSKAGPWTVTPSTWWVCHAISTAFVLSTEGVSASKTLQKNQCLLD